MSMMKKAENKMAYAKVGIYGNAGSGKTFTAAKIAIGLHQFAKCTKPIGMFDTEPAASFIIPLFEKAGIPFMVYDESRALRDLMAFMDEAEKECSIIIIDSITHVWRDAQESYIGKINDGLAKRGKRPIYALEFHHWRPIKGAWAEFTDRFLSSKLHVILCGRAGQIYAYQENQETGKKELITDGSKMATEKELGYEPSLLIEMIRKREDGRTINRALVEKDRSNSLQGMEIDMPDFDMLKGHFESLNLQGAHFESMDQRNSKEMFQEEGSDGWSYEQRQRQIICEEIAELMKKWHPSQSVDDKQARMDLLEQCFSTRSWTKVENTDSQDLRFGYEKLHKILEPNHEPIAPPAPQEFGDIA